MREQREFRPGRRAREFEAFVAGAAGRLLHVATLLTAEPADANPRAERLLTASLARTYATWHRLHGDDPYDRTRQDLAARFARSAWHRHRSVEGPGAWAALLPSRARGRASTRSGPTGRPADRAPLGLLTPQERLVLVLRLYEGVAEEQAAAQLGLPAERVRAICARSVARLLHAPRGPAPRLPRVAPT